jgi:hypothetical protein
VTLPARKGRVGMRVRGPSGLVVTLTHDRDNGYWDAVWADGKRDAVRDDYIGNHWAVLLDPPADTRAEAVQLGSRVQLSECLAGDVVDEIEGVEELTCRIVSTFRDGAYMTVLRHPTPREEGTERRFIGMARLVSRVAAAPVATPEVVRRASVRMKDIRRHTLRPGDVFSYRDDDRQPAAIFRAVNDPLTDVRFSDEALSGSRRDAQVMVLQTSADRRAAVSLRLAARAEARRFATQREEPGTSDNEPADWEWNQ